MSLALDKCRTPTKLHKVVTWETTEADMEAAVVEADAYEDYGYGRSIFCANHLGRVREQPALWAHGLYPG